MYFQLSKCTFSQQFQYRESIFFRLVGEIMYVYIQMNIWKALLTYHIDGRSFEEMVTYVLASQALYFLLDSEVPAQLAEKVRTGSIAIDLIRPVNLKWYTFWEQISANCFQLLAIGCPMVILSLLIWPVIRIEAVHCILFLVSAGLAVLLKFHFEYSVALLVFWFKDGTYARMLISGLMTIFSGRTIPLWFYPSFLYSICKVLPFRFMVYEPVAILLGQYQKEEAGQILLLQLLWLVFFWILAQVIWRKIQKQIEVQGG